MDGFKPRQHAVHIAVDHGVGQVEGDGGDGSSGVVANAFQFPKLFVVSGKLAAVFIHDLLRALVQVAGA